MFYAVFMLKKMDVSIATLSAWSAAVSLSKGSGITTVSRMRFSRWQV
jgi:hypothetical protein